MQIDKKHNVVILNNDYLYAGPFEDSANISFHIDDIVPGKTDLVLFTGGADVHPMLYKGRDCGISATNIGRDGKERHIFNFCKKHGIKMTGICRGFQFLNVMCGGFMYQHINNHGGCCHPVKFHDAEFIVTSTHHQLVGLGEGSIPMAWSSERRSNVYYGPQGNKVSPPEREMEAAIFPEEMAMGVQYHPEMMYINEEGRIHYEKMINDFICLEMSDFVQKYTKINGGKRWLQKIRKAMSRTKPLRLSQKSN